MKKLLLTVASLATLSFASNAQISFAPVLGLNLANQNLKSGGEKVETDMKMGLHIGAIAKIGITESLSFQPGLLYSMKGAKLTMDIFGTEMKASQTLSYIEVPLNVAYTLPMGVMFHAGPYLGYAISGKDKVEFDGESESTDTEFGSEDGMTKRLDYGLNIGAGYQLPMGLFFRAQYGLGLNNLVSGGDADNSIKNTCIGISVGYFLGGNR